MFAKSYRHQLQNGTDYKPSSCHRRPVPRGSRCQRCSKRLGWAAARPGGGCAGNTAATPPRVLFVFAASPCVHCGRLLGTPSLPWKWQHSMLILLPLPFMDLLASPLQNCLALQEMVSVLAGWVSPAPDLSPAPNGTPFPVSLLVCLAFVSYKNSKKKLLPLRAFS